MLHILPQLFFRLLRLGDCIPLFIQWYVVTGNVIGAVLFRYEIVQQALLASMRTGGVAVVGTSQRILEDGSRSPRRAVPIPISTLLDEVKRIPQNLKHISPIFEQRTLPGTIDSALALPLLAMILVESGTDRL